MLPLDRDAALRHILGWHMTNAIDVSNYGQTPTDVQIACLIAHNYERVIVGTSYGTLWRKQIAAYEAGGLEVHEYQFPTATKSTTRPWWLDCETPESTVDTIRAICGWANPPIGIYTRRGWWLTETQNWDIKAEFPALKLWDASYGDPPPEFVPYGGFAERAMHQWHDTTDLCGLSCDLNIIEEEDGMASAEYDKLKAALDAMYGSLISLAQHVYAVDDPKLADVKAKLDAAAAALTSGK